MIFAAATMSRTIATAAAALAVGGGGMSMGGGGLGIGTIIVLGLLGWALGIDPRILIGGADVIMGGGSGPAVEQRAPQQGQRGPAAPPSDQSGQFIAAILGNTEDVWGAVFKENGQTYRAPKLRIFSGATRSACGAAQSAMGPFYCPNDQRIYIDTSFFRDLERRFRGCSGKACEFAQAYVISHEVGHHIQNLLGVLPRAQQMQQAAGNRTEANRIQVRVELQADCFAGVWANRSNQKWKTIEPGDVEAAMQTAAAIGDDRIQKPDAGHGGAGFLHARLVGATAALVLDRPEGRQGVGLQHLQRAERLVGAATSRRA